MITLELEQVTKEANKYLITNDKYIILSGKFKNILAYTTKNDFERDFKKYILDE